MENKDSYYSALIENKGQLNEIELGENYGLEENEIREIIVQLLSEYKIEFVKNRGCSYSPMKSQKKKN